MIDAESVDDDERLAFSQDLSNHEPEPTGVPDLCTCYDPQNPHATGCRSHSLRRFAVPDTTCHMSISLDGFVAGPGQSREDPLGKRGWSCTAGISATREPTMPTRSRTSGSCARGARM